MASFSPTVPREVIGVRIQPGFFGRPCVEIRRRLVRVRFLSADQVVEEDVGASPWERMHRRDFLDVAIYLGEGVRLPASSGYTYYSANRRASDAPAPAPQPANRV